MIDVSIVGGVWSNVFAWPLASPKLLVISHILKVKITRNQLYNSGEAKKKPPPQVRSGTSQPNRVLDKEARDGVSAGNSPLTSPDVEQKILSRLSNVTKRADKSILDVVGEDFDLLSPNTSLHGNSTRPCFQPFAKNNVVMTCQKCQQKWHSTCHNLSGQTPTVSKKLMEAGWKFVRCYVLPYSGDQERAHEFKEFLSISSDIGKFNEELKEGFKSVEF
ncbi:hypothetical protein ACHWQZ_G009123 [Mnemiopsis leidyi]